MRGKILKNKLILTALTAILLVSCGGSGGGGGSSNLPINSGNNLLPTPKKPEIEDKINPAIPEKMSSTQTCRVDVDSSFMSI